MNDHGKATTDRKPMLSPSAWLQWMINDPRRVRARFLLAAACCLLTISLPALLLFHHYQLRATDAMVRDQGFGVLANYVTQTRDSIEKGQRKSFTLAMDNIAQLEGVSATSLYDRDGLMNYRSGEVTVGIPFVLDQAGNFLNPNQELYRQTRGMFLREDWHLADRIDSVRGRTHREQVAGRSCAECHFLLNEKLEFDQQGRAETISGRVARFYQRIMVENQCLVCHTNWRTGELAGVLGVDMDKGSFLAQARDSTRRLLYFLLLNAVGVLAVTFLVATMYRQILVGRRQLAEKSTSLAGLLDNSGQGFLSFGPDLLVESEYSRECETLLAGQPAGQPVAELLFGGRREEAELFAANIRRILASDDEFKRDTLLSLLPGEFLLGERQLEIAYRLIGPAKLMLIITDITEKRQLEARVAEEQTRLRLIVTAATEAAELFELLDEYRDFGRQELPNLLATADHQPQPALAEIYRRIHTFKGLFGQLEFIHLPRSLHQFESDLRRYRDQAEADRIDPQKLLAMLQQADAALEQDLELLRDTLGEDFFAGRSRLVLEPEEAEMLERLADRLLRAKGPALDCRETRAMLQKIKRLRYLPLRNLLGGYAKAAQRLARQREKELAPVLVEDGGLRVDPEVYTPFARSLVHLFRNAVDHGIETPEERWELDKEEEGHIFCRAREEEGRIILEIGDDGGGLNAEAIRRKAVASGRLTVEQAAAMVEQEFYQLIFADEFSTKDAADELSGRGVGLAAVRMETEKLGGSIEVESSPGQGTTFRFILPYLDPSSETSNERP